MSEQLCLFDIENLHNAIQIGDSVKIILPAESVCSETHYYLKYYYPQVINKIGQVVNVITGGFEVTAHGFLITIAPCAVQRNI